MLEAKNTVNDELRNQNSTLECVIKNLNKRISAIKNEHKEERASAETDLKEERTHVKNELKEERNKAKIKRKEMKSKTTQTNATPIIEVVSEENVKEEFKNGDTVCKLTAPGQVGVQKPPGTNLSSREGSKGDDYDMQKVLEENATPFNETEPKEQTSAIDKCISRLRLERPDLIDPPDPCKTYISVGSDTEDSQKLYGTDLEDSVDGFDSDFYMNNVF